MDHTLTPILLTLLPTYPSADAIPQRLHDLARALYAQSRSNAPSLKSNEEPARAWACVDIAIDRVTRQLDLPKKNDSAKPPVPPKVYKKLVAYLEGVLGIGTPRKNKSNAEDGGDTSIVTPSKKAPTTPSKGSSKSKATPTVVPVRKPDVQSTPSKRRKIQSDAEAAKEADADAPSWLMPTIRQLCKKFSVPEAVPHVYVGVVSVAKESRSSSPDLSALSNENMFPALLVAVLSTVMERLTGQDGNARTLRTALEELVALKRLTLKRFGEVLAETQSLLDEEKGSWWQMEWFGNIPGSEDTEMGGTGASQEDGSDNEESRNAKMRRRESNQGDMSGSMRGGLGTMVQDRTDWLSDERRADYVRWKAEMMRKIKAIEQRKTSTKLVVAS